MNPELIAQGIKEINEGATRIVINGAKERIIISKNKRSGKINVSITEVKKVV